MPEPKRRGLIRTFVCQFLNPLIYLLLAAAAVSLIIGEASDAAFIFSVLLINAAVGTIQEAKAERGTAALHRMLRQTAAARGIGTLHGAVLRDNGPMTRLCRDLGFLIEEDHQDPAVYQAIYQLKTVAT